MKVLSFVPSAGRVRSACFEERSLLPVAAACVVANALREALRDLFGAPVGLRLFAPMIPSASAWSALAERARLYHVRANAAEATIVLRPGDAVALARAAFGEPADERGQHSQPSRFEECAIDRIAAAAAAALTSVCGPRDAHAPERLARLGRPQTYFELQVSRPVAARIGVALARDPQIVPGGAIGLEALGGVGLELDCSLDLGLHAAAFVAALVPGTFLPITGAMEPVGKLRAAGRTFALGRCGVRDGRYALAVDRTFLAGRSPARAESERAS